MGQREGAGFSLGPNKRLFFPENCAAHGPEYAQMLIFWAVGAHSSFTSCATLAGTVTHTDAATHCQANTNSSVEPTQVFLHCFHNSTCSTCVDFYDWLAAVISFFLFLVSVFFNQWLRWNCSAWLIELTWLKKTHPRSVQNTWLYLHHEVLEVSSASAKHHVPSSYQNTGGHPVGCGFTSSLPIWRNQRTNVSSYIGFQLTIKSYNFVERKSKGQKSSIIVKN